jgi:hypothetical protein
MPPVGKEIENLNCLTSKTNWSIGFFPGFQVLNQIEQAIFTSANAVAQLFREKQPLLELSYLLLSSNEEVSSRSFHVLSSAIRFGDPSVAGEVARSNCIRTLITAANCGDEKKRDNSLTIFCQLSVVCSAVTALVDSGQIEEMLSACAAQLPGNLISSSTFALAPLTSIFANSCGLAAMSIANITAQISEVQILPGRQAVEQIMGILVEAVNSELPTPPPVRRSRRNTTNATGDRGAADAMRRRRDGASMLGSAEALCAVCALAANEDNHAPLLAGGIEDPLADLVIAWAKVCDPGTGGSRRGDAEEGRRLLVPFPARLCGEKVYCQVQPTSHHPSFRQQIPLCRQQIILLSKKFSTRNYLVVLLIDELCS